MQPFVSYMWCRGWGRVVHHLVFVDLLGRSIFCGHELMVSPVTETEDILLVLAYASLLVQNSIVELLKCSA